MVMRVSAPVSGKRRYRWIVMSLSVIIVACLTVVGLIISDYYRVTQTGATAPLPLATMNTDAAPSEKNPGPVAENYTVPADQPRSIRISKLKIDAYIQRVGVTKNNAMATPNNIAFTGWYIKSAVPGSVGLSIINGHAGGRYVDGVFKHLKDLAIGDSIEVQRGDLSRHIYKVVSVKTVSVADANTALYKRDLLLSKQLNVITCDGNFDDAAQTYDKRTIVVAKGD